ncbi:hypothetical protein PRUPE_1G164100 [Prunus persica]|uniref:Uncharacterized protein n=1 Tax=Prunus persica TaxID=3760 RepID=M5XYZ9_PRUPE|nr:hypothetical protein PRUPE_1G164100 [Prunus persica]
MDEDRCEDRVLCYKSKLWLVSLKCSIRMSFSAPKQMKTKIAQAFIYLSPFLRNPSLGRTYENFHFE